MRNIPVFPVATFAPRQHGSHVFDRNLGLADLHSQMAGAGEDVAMGIAVVDSMTGLVLFRATRLRNGLINDAIQFLFGEQMIETD
jgi:hypothetical protein